MKKTFLAFFACLAMLSLFSEIHPLSLETAPEWKKELVKAAVQAMLLAYAPYSKFFVGAALYTTSGKIILGANVENASYGLTICAERTAIFNAICQKEKDFQAIAISLKGSGSPCGACRQVLNEFNPDILVIMADENGEHAKECFLKDLLPDAFGPKNLSE
jgi:cytidine deaminase